MECLRGFRSCAEGGVPRLLELSLEDPPLWVLPLRRSDCEFPYRSACIQLAVAHGEDHVDRGFYLDWLMIEQVGAVAPCLDGFDGGLSQHRMAA